MRLNNKIETAFVFEKTLLMAAIFLISALPRIGFAEPIMGVAGGEKHGFAFSNLNNITNIRAVKVLVRSEKTISLCRQGTCDEVASDLQVSLVVSDIGPSTDLQPKGMLHLAMYNKLTEIGISHSLHLIAEIEELYSSKRVAPGIYQVLYLGFSLGSVAGENHCLYPKMRATIDARDLSVKVRAAKGFEGNPNDLEELIVTDPVEVTYKQLSCTDK